MKWFSLLVLCFSAVHSAEAHTPVVVEQTSLHDITHIDDPEWSQAFYGRLEGYPHTYEIRSTEPFELHVEVLLPDIENVSTDLTGIIIQETGFRGRVQEVTRLLGKDAAWESFYEPWGGDRYRRGGSYTGNAEAGVYRIEVSTPLNETPYVLVVGTREEWGDVGYLELIGRMADVKEFFGKSPLRVVESPLVYVPMLLLCLMIGAIYWIKRKRKGI